MLFVQSVAVEETMSDELLHRMAYAAKEFGETVWNSAPGAVVQLSVWTEHGVDEVIAGYAREKIVAQIGHEDVDSPEVFWRLRSEIDEHAASEPDHR